MTWPLPRPRRVPSAKLDEEKALQIHRLHAQGRGLRDLAEQFGVEGQVMEGGAAPVPQGAFEWQASGCHTFRVYTDAIEIPCSTPGSRD